MVDEYYPITQNIIRNLLDKLYEKRKSAAIDIEKMVKQFQNQGKDDEIRMIIKHCGETFCVSSNCHNRKGGTIGLAAVAIALGKHSDVYCSEIICPTIRLLQDSDPRVRYYACESLYNCIKVLGGNVMPHFQSLFDCLAKGYEDPDKDVRSAIVQLDRSLRETVVDCEHIDVASIVTFLKDKIYPKSTQTRHFIINWIASLDRTNGVNMVLYLPEVLDGLMLMLDDSDESLVTKLKHLLNQFLNKLIDDDHDQGYRRLINILVFQINDRNCRDIIKQTALIWLAKFIQTFKGKVLPFTSIILKAILPYFDVDGLDDSIRKEAREVSSLLLDLVRSIETFVKETDHDTSECDDLNTNKSQSRLIVVNNNNAAQPFNTTEEREPTYDPKHNVQNINEKLRPIIHCSVLNFPETLNVLCEFSGQYSQQTKLAALDWLHTLMDVAAHQTVPLTEIMFPSLFKFAIDPSSEVIRAGLKLVAKFSQEDINPKIKDSTFLNVPDQIKSVLPLSTNSYFLRFIFDLVRHLDTDLKMLEEKGDLIFGDLCYHLSPELVFNTIAEIIQKSDELQERFLLVNKLNRILLSNPDLIQFRSKIKSINSEESCHIFSRLYRAWSFNRVALLSLCLLSQNYEHCRRLIKTFGDQEMNVDTLNEIDLLIQFLEAPVFAFLRMHLMDPRHASALSETLYGLLMLLPQSDAFKILQNRLNCIPRHDISGLTPYNYVSDPNYKLIAKHVDFNGLLENLYVVQNKRQLQMLKNQHQLYSIHLSSHKVPFSEKHMSL